MTDYSHLNALELRLSHERARLARDNSPIRQVWVAGIEKEFAEERRFLGLPPIEPTTTMTDDELIAALFD